jgi:hypothetical protein
MPFPFLFYGRRPGDWYEGRKIYAIRFKSEPDAAARRALGGALATLLQRGERLAFAGARAELSVEEVSIDDEPDVLFNRVEKILAAAHRVAPIDQVVMKTARARGKSAWDKWTLEQRAVPARDGAPAVAIDADFEDGRAQKAAGGQAKAAAKAKAKGEVALVRTRWTPPSGEEPDGLRRAIAAAKLPGPVLASAASPDGARILVACERHPYGVVVELTMRGKAVREVFEPVPFNAIARCQAVAYAADGLFVAGSAYFVYLVDLATGELVAHVRCSCASAGLTGVLGGRVIVARTFDGATKTFVWSVAKRKLSAIARLKTSLHEIVEDEGRVYADGGSDWLELVNLPQA